jgi:chromosome segregation ATPase
MQPQQSTISDGLGISVLGLLGGLSALCFLVDHLATPVGEMVSEKANSMPVPTSVADNPADSDSPATAQLAEVTATRDALQRDLDSMTRERVEVDGELNRLKKEMALLNEDLTSTRSAAENATAQLAAQQNRIDDFDRERARLAAELEVARAGTGFGGDPGRLKAEYDSFRRKVDADRKDWEATSAQLQAALANLNQQNELLKSRLTDNMRQSVPGVSGSNAMSALEETENQIATLKEKVVALEQKLDSLGNQRNELARALRAAHLNRTGANNAASR